MRRTLEEALVPELRENVARTIDYMICCDLRKCQCEAEIYFEKVKGRRSPWQPELSPFRKDYGSLVFLRLWNLLPRFELYGQFHKSQGFPVSGFVARDFSFSS